MDNTNYCHQCSVGDGDKELRPYGPKGEWVCFKCAFGSQEAKATTEAMFEQQLAACGNSVLIGLDVGPVPATTEIIDAAMQERQS